MTYHGGPSRAGDYPRITFHTQDRTFDRLLKESSLSDLKKTVRTKLGLQSGSVVQLAQLRHGQSIDLEDEDDFDAFYSLAYEQRLVAVQVTLADNLSAEDSLTDLEERPRKKYKRKHEAQTSLEQEAESHIENHVSFGKKRKVAFTEPSAETGEPTSSPEGPQKKKKTDDSSTITEPNRGLSHSSSEAQKKKKNSLSHDSTEEPRMKKRKRKSAMDFEADDGAQSSTPSKRHPLPSGSETSHTELKALPGADSDQSVPEHSTLNEQEGPTAVEVPATRSKKKGVAPTESSTLEEALRMSFSSTTKTPKKPTTRKPDHANEKGAKPTHPPTVNIDDANTSSGSSDGAQKDDNLARNVRDKDGHNVLDYPKGITGVSGGIKNRKRSSTVNANNVQSVSNIDNGPIKDTGVVSATAEKPGTNNERASSRVKEVINKVTKKKRSTVAGPSPVDAPGGSPDSAAVNDRPVTNGTTKMPVDGAKKGAGSSKISAEACLVCSRTPKHELVDCPIVEEGPASIQKRIKSLRARKIPDHEKLPLISELQKLKAEQRENGKRQARVVKKAAIEPGSQSAFSPSADEGTKDVGGHTNDVAGVSKESRPVNQTSLSSERSSGTPSDEMLSLDAGAHSIIDAKWVVNNDPIILPDIGDVSGLANVDLDVLMKGPESSFLSINDMPSSDNDSDEEEMSGGPDSDEVGKTIFAKLMRDDSSDSDTNDSQGDERDESENHVIQSPRHIQSPETDDSSGPKRSEDDDTSGDNGSDVNASTVNAVRDTETTEITGLSGGQVDDAASAPTAHSSSPNPINTSEEQQNMNSDWKVKQDSLERVSSNEEPPRSRKGRDESSSHGGASSGQKRVKAAKSTKKTDGFSLSQVSKELEESAARNPKTSARVKNKSVSNTSNRSAAKLAADTASVQRSTTSVDNWTAWKEELSSHPDDDGSTLVDELLPSSSPVATRLQPHRNKKAFTGTASKDDISEPPNSQPSLPFSPKTRLQDPIEDAESNSENEAKDGDSRRRTRNSRYRRLSEIRSESIHKSLQVPRLTPSAPRDKATALYGKRGRTNESESESSSDSDSEVERQSHSHIPKRRVAGMS